MSLKKLKTVVQIDLNGNVLEKTNRLSTTFAAAGKAGSYSMALLNKTTAAFGQGLDKLSNRYTAFITGAAGGMAVRGAAALETRLEQLGIVADKSGVYMQKLNERMLQISQKRHINIDPSQLLSAVEQISAKTGELSVAEENLENIAMVISATGAGGEDVGSLFSNIFEKFNVKDAKEMLGVIDALANQGKMGAFELRDLATQGERIISAYAAMGRTGKQAAVEMGTMMQLGRKGVGSTEQAATAFEAVVRNLTDPKVMANLKSVGINVKDAGGNFRAIPDIIKEIVIKADGETEELGKVFDTFAQRMINPIAIAFNQAKKEGKTTAEAFAAMTDLMEVSSTGESVMADSARMAKTFEASVVSLKSALTGFANRNLAEPISKLANALNSISPEQMDKFFSNFAKGAALLGTVVAGYKLSQGIGSVINFFKPGKGGIAGVGGNLLSGIRTPVPVYVVNGGAFGAMGAAADMVAGGKGKAGMFAQFLSKHQKLAKIVAFGGKALKVGGYAGMAYSAYQMFAAENKAQLGAGAGTIIGGIIGSLGGPLGIAAGAYIGDYLGEKIGMMFDKQPEVIAKAEAKRREEIINRSEVKIDLGINPKTGAVELAGFEEKSPSGGLADLDLSVGGVYVGG